MQQNIINQESYQLRGSYHSNYDLNASEKIWPAKSSFEYKCKPPLATPRGKLRLHVKLIQAEEQN